MTQHDAPADRPLRADARRNRARVLAAAEAVFTMKGTSASTEEVARAAGVGIGTVFRHFPTKEALLEALVAGRLTELTERAETLATADAPGEALFALVTHAVELSATKIAVMDALTRAGVDVEHALAPVTRRVRDAVQHLLIRAQRAGEVRDDIATDDLVTLMVGVARATEHTGFDPDARARTLAIIFDGLRAARPR